MQAAGWCVRGTVVQAVCSLQTIASWLKQGVKDVLSQQKRCQGAHATKVFRRSRVFFRGGRRAGFSSKTWQRLAPAGARNVHITIKSYLTVLACFSGSHGR